MKIKNYKLTAFSGEIGPKLKEGDRQIPEGIYKITFLNPNSSYHLSMKINYPNDFDRRMGNNDGREFLGSDIMIHGMNVTIGCIPVGNPGIEELFVLANNAGIDNTIVVIAPKDFRKDPSYPQIKTISWVNVLYDNLNSELTKYH
ncbi:MAG: L,D-transpeptidase family protein [Lentisphaerae bacterium]|nr:L,D-transpeptidase family protein [Lentisphaerota bacterium]MCP4102479.1 L,D-transpeptidase family protein [Lentisphaerota bacterium]